MYFSRKVFFVLLIVLPGLSHAKNLKLIESFDQAKLEETLIGSEHRFKISVCKNWTEQAKKKGINNVFVLRCSFYSYSSGYFLYSTGDREFAQLLTTYKAQGVELRCTPSSITKYGRSREIILCDPKRTHNF